MVPNYGSSFHKPCARHLWHFISSSRYLPKKYRDIIEPVISRNSYFFSPENMLLAMLTDERCLIRTLAARLIIKARKIGPNGNYVRRFVITAVTFEIQTTWISLSGKLVMSHRLQFSDISVVMNF
ncbi:hypothetical protein AVEN_217301-1 [Araneus ventricosus]|uniref:Uncharacterized protein n=1 Tax=Araneus ventricosus TaxID=182803 RepID=A0A4Y2EDB8_ARAVE|nr:hypothetical protein AVEN_217301-1 [Araneus ventricosus]